MNFTLKIQAEAVIEIHDAFEWYEAQKEGLGLAFIGEIESGLKHISNHPQYYTSINTTFRRFKINRFPYLIIYEIDQDIVIVNSVRHGSRKPKY
jgi:plasmid stabilization system protein ParE